MCKDFRDDRFPFLPDKIDYSGHGGQIEQRVASLSPEILGADLIDLQDTRGLPRVGEETLQKMLAIMALTDSEYDTSASEVA